ncbi:MAG: cell division protein FtsJ [Chloroflexota bacterium]|nr:cell division protein FtsJ [Chloroflexota bacterium]
MSTPRVSEQVVFTAAADYFPAAAQELQVAFPRASITRLAPDTGAMSAPGVGIDDVAATCRQRPVVFVRHLMRATEVLPLAPAADFADRASALCLALARGHQLESIALQVWMTGEVNLGERPDTIRRHVEDHLRSAGVEVARAGRPQTLPLCITPAGAFFGITPTAATLAEWPGGRVSLAKRAGQISRAELKLDELFKLYSPPIPADGAALDLGASPGGWTHVLRRLGFTVWAVDPAPLDARLAGDPAIHHIATTAGAFLARTDHNHDFDLVVNDMRMVPSRSCTTMLTAAHRLRPGGCGIVTLKLSPQEPLRVVAASFRRLERVYDVLFARQLFHNRNEVTVVCQKPA